MIAKIQQCKASRLETANKVLASFTKNTRLRLDSGYVIVEWVDYKGNHYARRWMTRGQEFYPVWYKKWVHGGTASTALSQLVRWVQGKPVLPLSTWRYWAGDSCRLLPLTAIQYLEEGGYPPASPCVLCGSVEYKGGLDWWSLNGVTGPACWCCRGKSE